MDEMVECAVLREPNLTFRDMLGRKAVSEIVTRIDGEQQVATACLQREVKYYEGQAAHRSTAVFSEKRGSDNKDGAAGSGSREGSHKEPERKGSRTN